MKNKAEKIIHIVLHFLERFIAFLTLAVLVVMLGMEIYRMCTVSGYLTTVDLYLQNILTIVVGLEFVRMLTDMTPDSIIEVLIAAIARHVILLHNDPWNMIACVISIAALFATRHFLVPDDHGEKLDRDDE